ncbi:DUF4435 domain-containing protein [Anaeroarcus burkinensis]|uniref:DUF4435 domain-containing protein n=1 Tax=Anaeroarcus burkinensis TaxID=82376 RepID=UPI00040C9798|nr:DUF4435 domain-containing protein [Anaeroarcus burkinensis]
MNAARPFRKEVFDCSYFASEIRQICNYPDHRSVMLVEGESDQRLFKNFINTECCCLRSLSYKKERGNRDRILEFMRNCSRYRIVNWEKSIIGIIDDDYDRLIDESIQYGNNVFSTDERDIEGMMFATSAIDRMINEYVDLKKLEKFKISSNIELVAILSRLCLPVGFLRLLNKRFRWGISFQELPWERFVDTSQWNLKEEELCDMLVSTNISGAITPHKRGITKSVVWEQYLQLDRCELSKEPWKVCRGHDVIEVFVKYFARDNINTVDGPESSLRTAYRQEDFQKSELYKAMYDWHNKSQPWKIF